MGGGVQAELKDFWAFGLGMLIFYCRVLEMKVQRCWVEGGGFGSASSASSNVSCWSDAVKWRTLDKLAPRRQGIRGT